MKEAASQEWSARSLDRQIVTLSQERLLANTDRAMAHQLAKANHNLIAPSARQRSSPVLVMFAAWSKEATF